MKQRDRTRLRERERRRLRVRVRQRERKRQRKRNRKSIADCERGKRERMRGRYRKKERQTVDSDELCTNVITFYPRPQSRRFLSGMFFLNLSSRRRVLKGADAFSGWEKARKATKIDNSWHSSLAKGDTCAEEYYRMYFKT